MSPDGGYIQPGDGTVGSTKTESALTTLFLG